MDSGEELSRRSGGAVAVLSSNIPDHEDDLWYRLSLSETVGELIEKARDLACGRIRGSPLLALECDSRMAAFLRNLADYEPEGGAPAPRARLPVAFVLGRRSERSRRQWAAEGILPIFVDPETAMKDAAPGPFDNAERLDWLIFVSEVYRMARDLGENDVFFLATSRARLVEGAGLRDLARNLPPAIGWWIGYRSFEGNGSYGAGRLPIYFWPTGVIGSRETADNVDQWRGWTSGAEVLVGSLQLLRVLFAATMQLPDQLRQEDLLNYLLYSGVIGSLSQSVCKRAESLSGCPMTVPLHRGLLLGPLLRTDRHLWSPPISPLRDGEMVLHGRSDDCLSSDGWSLVDRALIARSQR